jgi:hypothetical protein
MDHISNNKYVTTPMSMNFNTFSQVKLIYCIFMLPNKLKNTVTSIARPWKGITYLHFSILDLYLKGKAVLLQAWSGPEGSRKLRFPDFMTTAQDGGKVISLTHWPPLLPRNTPGTHFC